MTSAAHLRRTVLLAWAVSAASAPAAPGVSARCSMSAAVIDPEGYALYRIHVVDRRTDAAAPAVSIRAPVFEGTHSTEGPLTSFHPQASEYGLTYTWILHPASGAKAIRAGATEVVIDGAGIAVAAQSVSVEAGAPSHSPGGIEVLAGDGSSCGSMRVQQHLTPQAHGARLDLRLISTKPVLGAWLLRAPGGGGCRTSEIPSREEPARISLEGMAFDVYASRSYDVKCQGAIRIEPSEWLVQAVCVGMSDDPDLILVTTEGLDLPR